MNVFIRLKSSFQCIVRPNISPHPGATIKYNRDDNLLLPFPLVEFKGNDSQESPKIEITTFYSPFLW